MKHTKAGSAGVRRRELLAAGGPESSLAPGRLSEIIGLVPLDGGDLLDDELGDTVADLDLERLRGVVVDQDHPDLVAVAGVDQTRGVQAAHAVAERQTRPGQDETGPPRRD